MIAIKLHEWLLDGLKLDGNSWPQLFILVEMYWKHLVEPCIHYHWLNVFVGLCNLYLSALAIYVSSDVLALYCWIIVYHKSQPCILSWSLPNTDFKCICCTWKIYICWPWQFVFVFVGLGNLYLLRCIGSMHTLLLVECICRPWQCIVGSQCIRNTGRWSTQPLQINLDWPVFSQNTKKGRWSTQPLQIDLMLPKPNKFHTTRPKRKKERKSPFLFVLPCVTVSWHWVVPHESKIFHWF